MSFEKVIGQKKAVSILKGYLENNCLEGGYLFTGPGGVGKKLTSLELAKALNCQQDFGDACDNCISCRKITNAQHPDIHVIAKEDDEIKIEDIRNLQREIGFRPYEGKKKLFIIDNAHKLTAEASNALLKVLEEPPKSSLIVLISDKPALLLRTIVSRCKVLKFSALLREEIKGILEDEYSVEKGQAHFLAYFCEGSLGRALRLKDTDIFSRKNIVIDKFILSEKPSIESLSPQNKAEILSGINIAATWFRDIYLSKAGIRESELIHYDRRQEISGFAEVLPYARLNQIIDSLSKAVLYLDQNINTRLLLYELAGSINLR
ncbi:MAG: DNA polymerase III subunit delta' [Candidatus Omnitrophica bacterium]|nr:DNA polymerase III subunit delta' [Candidatus Omnitrophota bacterium]